jgi:hypothetical protein
MDLAIVVRGASGATALLSWGEIYYRNPAEFVLAYDGTGLLPHTDCADCHAKETYEPWRSQITRSIPFPKLVATGDRFAERSIEGVTSIAVVELGADRGYQVAKQDAPEDIRAEAIRAVTADGQAATIEDLGRHARLARAAIQAGDGTGYHGIRRYEGVALADALRELGYGLDPTAGFVLSARDGYRVLLSNGEIFSAAGGGEVLLADTLNGTPLTDSGRFQLVPVADLAADRWLKGVATLHPVRAAPAAESPARQ